MEVDTHISLQWILGALGVLILQGIGLVIWLVSLKAKTENNTDKIKEQGDEIKENSEKDKERSEKITKIESGISQIRTIIVIIANHLNIKIPEFDK